MHLTYQQARPNNNINRYLLNHTPRIVEEEWRSPTSNLGKVKSFSLQVSHKTLSKLERKYPKKYYSIMKIKINFRISKN
ncbi:hypothetical protein H5410_021821 [Solanum commersonii]|uniref:Uncharacterized protein n=1 Tax=Solanum commersonii TaxID=4109 RepID=A0A9J5ZGD5_SOLCO|nr:hypothetical protein H5410_021821 [Solanum commersonii]